MRQIQVKNPPLCNVKETINPTVNDNILTSPLSRRDFFNVLIFFRSKVANIKRDELNHNDSITWGSFLCTHYFIEDCLGLYFLVSIIRRGSIQHIGWINLLRFLSSVQYHPNLKLPVCLIETLVKHYRTMLLSNI